jgi:hypothetical protein
MTTEEAEQLLSQWATVSRDRDARVRTAIAAGITKHRVHQLAGIGRFHDRSHPGCSGARWDHHWPIRSPR